MYMFFKVLCAVSILHLASGQDTQNTTRNDSKDQLDNAGTTALLNQLLANMDFRVRPNVHGEAVVVTCDLDVVNFGEISDSHMDYNVNIYLRSIWHDKRLAYTNSTQPLVISPQLINNMWTPDLYFPTEKKAAFHDVTVPNRLMRVYPDGKVVYSMRLTLTLACPMDLTHFPMDHQECTLMMESYSNEEKDLRLEWNKSNPIEIANKIELPQFDLVQVNIVDCTASTYKTGSFSCIKARFSLKRQYGYFILQTYVPSILIVIISWVSFWINMDAIPARISMGVTTVLTMTTQLSGSKASIPRISYPKAIDIWMMVCMIFVFGVLIEFAFVNSLSRKHLRRGNTIRDKGDVETGGDDETFAARRKRSLAKSVTKTFGTRETARLLDKLSRVLFPLSFMVFNIIYWPYFIHG